MAQDPTPAVFMAEDTAALAMRAAVKTMKAVRKALVFPHVERGAMRGYLVMLHFKDHYTRARPMSNTEFEEVCYMDGDAQ